MRENNKNKCLFHFTSDEYYILIVDSWSAMCACSKFLYFCGGINADESRSDQILRYDPKKYSLEILPSMEGKRNDAAAIFYEGCLYVLGGYDGSSTLNTVCIITFLLFIPFNLFSSDIK